MRVGRAEAWWGCLGPVPVTHNRAPPSLMEPSPGGIDAAPSRVVARHPHQASARPTRMTMTEVPRREIHRQRMSRRDSASKSSVSVSVMTRIMTSAHTKTIWVARISRL